MLFLSFFLSSEDETSPSSVESDTLQSADLGRFSHFHCIVLFTPYPTFQAVLME